MVANLFAKESEKRRQSTSEKLENNLRKHYSNTENAIEEAYEIRF